MTVLELLWNCFLVLLFLGVLKAALSFYWPSIGEWRYDDLHPSLRYHESCRAKQLLVNGVFFIVYPCVLCYRWYTTNRWKLWTECNEQENFGRSYVEYSREEEELLRHGVIRGRMIVQQEIVLNGAMNDELSSYRKYDDVDDCIVAVDKRPLDEQNNPSECVPLNLSKDGEGMNNEEIILLEYPTVDTRKVDTILSSSEEERDGDEIRLIPQFSKAREDAPSSGGTEVSR